MMKELAKLDQSTITKEDWLTACANLKATPRSTILDHPDTLPLYGLPSLTP